MNRWAIRVSLVAVWVAAVSMGGCHADENDPKGLAEELADPVRREHSISHLQRIFGQRLAEAKGDRSAAPIKEFADQTHEHLTKIFIEHPEDSQNGYRIIQLMAEMRDQRTLPALLKALKWRKEVSENHAVSAAKTIAHLDLPADKKTEAVGKIAESLERVDGKRGADNRMRKAFIETLGALKDKAATKALISVATKQEDSQNFLFNRLAAEQLAVIADPVSVQPMIRALFLFAPNNPAMRMNDVASAALVAIGKPALAPLIELLKGRNQEANKTTKLYIEAIRHRDPNAAAEMNPKTIVSAEATFTLGKLGYGEAFDPLLAETQVKSEARRNAAAIALVSLKRNKRQTAATVGAIKRCFGASKKIARPQLLVALQHMYSDGALSFLLENAKKEERELPDIRVLAYKGYALLANKAEARPLKAVRDKEPREGGFRAAFDKYDTVLAATETCDTKLDCWVSKLKDKDKLVVLKGANMLARFGRGNETAIAGLVAQLGHRDLEVRYAVLNALDHVAVRGSKEAVAKIDELQRRESGRSIWNRFKGEALPTRHRLAARATG